MEASQIAGDWRTTSHLRRRRRRSICICITVSSDVHVSKRFGVIQQGVEHRLRVKHGDLVQVVMFGFKTRDVGSKLGVIVGDRNLDVVRGIRSRFNKQWRAVGRRDSEEEE